MVAFDAWDGGESGSVTSQRRLQCCSTGGWQDGEQEQGREAGRRRPTLLYGRHRSDAAHVDDAICMMQTKATTNCGNPGRSGES